jgi:hypothetical protein
LATVTRRYNERHRLGDGRPRDESEAFLWLKRAAINGHINGQYNLGFAYLTGMGTNIDEKKAFAWFAQAAYGHNNQAQNSIAWMYYDGISQKKIECLPLYGRLFQ